MTNAGATAPSSPDQPKARFCHLARHTDRTVVLPIRLVLSAHRENVDTYRVEECGADQGRGFLLARTNRTVHGRNVAGSQDRCACLGCLERRALDTGKPREGVQPGSAKPAT